MRTLPLIIQDLIYVVCLKGVCNCGSMLFECVRPCLVLGGVKLFVPVQQTHLLQQKNVPII